MADRPSASETHERLTVAAGDVGLAGDHRLEEMTPLFERGQARVAVERILPLEQAIEAHRRLDTGHGWGKVVLQVA